MTRKTFNYDQRAFLVHLLTHQEIKDFFFGKLDLEEVLDEEAIHELHALGIPSKDQEAFIKLWNKLKSLNGISDDLNWLRSSNFKEDGEIITKLCAQLLERMAILKQEAYKQGYNVP